MLLQDATQELKKAVEHDYEKLIKQLSKDAQTEVEARKQKHLQRAETESKRLLATAKSTSRAEQRNKVSLVESAAKQEISELTEEIIGETLMLLQQKINDLDDKQKSKIVVKMLQQLKEKIISDGRDAKEFKIRIWKKLDSKTALKEASAELDYLGVEAESKDLFYNFSLDKSLQQLKPKILTKLTKDNQEDKQ